MLFHLELTHSPEVCFKHNEVTRDKFFSALGKSAHFGVEVKFIVGNSMEHSIFMLIEADTAEGVHQWLDPIVYLGHIELTSVIEKKL